MTFVSLAKTSKLLLPNYKYTTLSKDANTSFLLFPMVIQLMFSTIANLVTVDISGQIMPTFLT